MVRLCQHWGSFGHDFLTFYLPITLMRSDGGHMKANIYFLFFWVKYASWDEVIIAFVPILNIAWVDLLHLYVFEIVEKHK